MKINLPIVLYVVILFSSIVNAEEGVVFKSTTDDQIGVEVVEIVWT